MIYSDTDVNTMRSPPADFETNHGSYPLDICLAQNDGTALQNTLLLTETTMKKDRYSSTV